LCRAAPGVGRSGAPSGADLGCSSEYSIRGCVRVCVQKKTHIVGYTKTLYKMTFYIWLRTGVWRRFPRQQRLNAGQSVLSQLTRFSELRKLQAKQTSKRKEANVGFYPPPKRRGLVGWLLLQKSASGIDEQADGSKVLCSWRVVGTASLLEN